MLVIMFPAAITIRNHIARAVTKCTLLVPGLAKELTQLFLWPLGYSVLSRSVQLSRPGLQPWTQPGDSSDSST